MNQKNVGEHTARDGGSPEIATACQASCNFEPTQNLRAVQAKTLARRHRLAPNHAYVIAPLLFGEARQ